MMHVLANVGVKPAANVWTTSIIPYLTNFTWLFMMVSAFSMCCGYYERVKEGLIKPVDFYRRRYERIWPFFAIMVVLSVAIDRDLRSLQEGFLDLTLCFNLLPGADIETVGVGWFLGTIFTFYMLFPFFTYCLANRRKGWFVLVVSLLMVVVSAHPLFEMGEIGRSNIIYSGPFFIVGGLIYLYRETLGRWVATHRWLAAVLTIALSIGTFIVPWGEGLPIARELVFYTILTIYALGSRDWLLNNPITRYLSRISMEIYLCHMMCFRVASLLSLDHFVADTTWLYVLTTLLTLAGAIVFSHVVKLYLLPRLMLPR